MKKIFVGSIFALACLTMATSAFAAPVLAGCPGGGITNITSDPGDQYNCGGLTFTNFSVSEIGAILGIGTGSGINGNEVQIDWNMSNVAAPGDLTLIYKVTGPTSGVDLSFIGTANGNPGPNQNSVVINELVCTVGISAAGCAAGGQVEANFGGTSSSTVNTNGFSQAVSYSGGVQQVVWIKKDIQFNGDFSLTDFENSNMTGVPEPTTYSMVGGALLCFGLLGRKKFVPRK